jgi:hypothetical protein
MSDDLDGSTVMAIDRAADTLRSPGPSFDFGARKLEGEALLVLAEAVIATPLAHIEKRWHHNKHCQQHQESD